MPMKRSAALAATIAAVAFTGITVTGSSHREAPGITKTPKLDGTDFYMFRSFEPGRAEYVTLLAHYLPLQDVFAATDLGDLSDRITDLGLGQAGDEDLAEALAELGVGPDDVDALLGKG